MANACRIFGARAIIAVPEGANLLKVESMRNLGADVLFHGRNFDEAREYSERLSKEEGYRFVHAANEPLLVSGVATCYLEVVEDFPQVEYICWQSAQVGQIRTREDYYYEELRGSSLRDLL